jgi:hypothetical protein
MFFRKKPNLVTFEHARSVLLTVLADVGEEFWREKLASVSSDSFRRLLGGMGSFSDLVICVENKHRVADDKEPLANELISCLRTVCYVTAQRGPIAMPDAVAACGTAKATLHGWRCLACGHSRVSNQDIRAFVAFIAVRDALKKDIEEVLHVWRSREDNDTIQRVVNLVTRSGIALSNDDAWMRPCASCKSEDTCVYRWQLREDSFLPTPDNLPLKPKIS